MCFSLKAESTAYIHFSAPAPHLFFIPQPTAQTSRLIPKHPNGTNEKTKRHNLQKRGKNKHTCLYAQNNSATFRFLCLNIRHIFGKLLTLQPNYIRINKMYGRRDRNKL